MPNSPIPCSLPEPNNAETHYSLARSIVHLSDQSLQSTTSTGANWPKKISNIVARRKESDLTVECLQELNRINKIQEDKRYSTSSPYFNGLTDFSLAVNRERLLVPVSSPERESHEVTCVSSNQLTEVPVPVSTGTAWPKKISNIMARRKDSDLTEESLEEWNRRYQIQVDKRYSTSGPYYKGLTEFSLVINRESLPIPVQTSGRQSHEATSVGSNQLTELPVPVSTGIAWPKKISNIIAQKDDSDLTEESFKEFNRTNAILEDKRYPTSSPYSKGLTDFSLVISKEKLPVPVPVPVPLSSPGRESNEATSVSSSSGSSFIVKIQEWSTSCFLCKHKEEMRTSSSSSSLLSPSTQASTIANNAHLEKKDVSFLESDFISLKMGKPLRERVSQPSLKERVSEPPSTSLPPPVLESTLTSLPLPLSPSQPSTAPRPPWPETSQSPHTPPPKTSTVSPPQMSPTKKAALNAMKTSVTENERKFIWADRYRPVALKDFICNRNKAIELQDMAIAEDCCHFIFEGPPGVGKRTMIWAYLREAFGPDKIQSREELKEFDLKGEAVSKIHVNVKESSQHIEVNLSEVKGYEKHVIVELIKETNTRFSNKVLKCSRDACRAIILYEADKLSTDALLYVKWLLERNKGCNKVFFCCNDIAKLQPIKSICTLVQLVPPSNEEIIEVLEFIAKQEGIELTYLLAEQIANNAKNNLRQAIRSFEATWQSNLSAKEDQVILTGWEDEIANIAKNIVEEQSPKQLYNIRGKLQKLIEHNVSSEFIFQMLVGELKKHLDEQLQIKVDILYEEYNRDDGNDKRFAFTRNRQEKMSKKHNDPLRKNVQHFMRIEEFIAKFMSLYKGSTSNNKGE